VDEKTGCDALTIDIETIDTADKKYTSVVDAFNYHGAWALPMVTLNGAVVTTGIKAPGQIVDALEKEILKVTGA
jgi:hypothetical protein